MKLALTLIFCCLTAISSLAQDQRTITGIVYYAEDQTPVPFAYVRIKGIALGTVTDVDGTFKLIVPGQYLGRPLEFSYLGLKSEELEIPAKESPIKIYLETDVQELYAVIVTGSRPKNPKGILKKVVKSIPENYINEEYQSEGFYREFVKEHNNTIKYADASFLLNLKGHNGAIKKSNSYEKPNDPSKANTVGSWTSQASSLHRWHFHQKVLKGEKAKIINAKSSDDLTKTNLSANIQGGPLSIMTKDRVKYPFNFMTDYSKYNYELLEVMQDNQTHYLITFEPKKEPYYPEEIKNGSLPWKEIRKSIRELRKAVDNKHKLSGSILINKKDLAIIEMNYGVPDRFKNELCGYRSWSIRHFDFKVSAKYKKSPLGYSLSYLRHEDEFIVEDTINEVRIPYAAISELYVHRATPITERIPADQNFSNSDFNHLFDYPDGYDKKYWDDYEQAHPEADIPLEISNALRSPRPLEVQFSSKLISDSLLTPPIAPIKDHTYIIHGQSVRDEYAWLKDTINARGNQEVMNYLALENQYTDNYFRPLKPLRKDIYTELRSYIQEEYQSLSTTENGYRYYYKYEREKEHPIYYRVDTTAGSIPELLFDVNRMAEGKEYFALSGIQISPNNQLAAFQINETGTDEWTLKFKDLKSNTILADSITMVGEMAWYDNSTIYHTSMNPKTYRSGKLYRYQLGSGPSELVYEEKDELFSLSLSRSRSRKMLFLNSKKSESNEIRFLEVGTEKASWKVIAEREEGHQYSVRHYQDKFLIVSNQNNASNNQVFQTSTDAYQRNLWQILRPQEAEIEILSIVPFKNYLVYQERHGLEYKIKVIEIATGKSHYIKQYDMQSLSIGNNPDYDTDTLQYNRNRYTNPNQILNYHMGKKKSKHVKYDGKFLPVGLSKTEQVYATAKDGTEVPITLIYHKDKLKKLTKEGKTPPLYITGYGAYGSRNIPSYNPNIDPLIQGGGIYAIAHVRGGGDLGNNWYKAGKMMNKMNTFNDFIACTEHLIALGYGKTGEVVAEGGSAGGLLMGAIANMRPDLYGLIVLDVPFVDVINTMLDDQLPLTKGEYEEWGNPNKKTYFEYIHKYSPYENVENQAYPNMLFLTAINDTRVGYWEPAKMIARLRRKNTGNSKMLLKTDFSSGHGGASGRYAQLAQLAFKYAWIVDWMNGNHSSKTATTKTSP